MGTLTSLLLLAGCGASGIELAPQVLLSPATATISPGVRLRLTTSGLAAGVSCAWSSSDQAVLTALGNGEFRGVGEGNATVSALCGTAAEPAVADLVVSSTPAAPLVITHGGTYIGNWRSDAPDTPAITVATDQPVTISDSVVSGRGDLIVVSPTRGVGANLTVHDVTGVALDPQRTGAQRGSFLVATGNMSLLRVHHCSMVGVSFGVQLLSSRVRQLAISENLGTNLEDRASDGNGGLTAARPQLGHFIFLNQVAAPIGAEISWNQLSNTMGRSSIEDVINIYKSQGAPSHPIHIHDNFLEGFSSTTTASYTGTGIIADGDAHAPVTAYTLAENNQIVHAAGSGIEIAAGHDITVTNNRIVSCGRRASGAWYAMPFVNAVVVWNYYNGPALINDSVQGTQGGVLRPSPEDTPQVADLWARSDDLLPSDPMGPNAFTDPCLVNGAANTAPEDAEHSYWKSKLAGAGVVLGDRHMR